MSPTEPKTTGSPAPETGGTAATVDGFSAADTSDIADMNYEQARSELVETVSRLEAGGAGLEESLALWERGEALANRCEAWLDGARARLHQVRSQVADVSADTDGGTEAGADRG